MFSLSKGRAVFPTPPLSAVANGRFLFSFHLSLFSLSFSFHFSLCELTWLELAFCQWIFSFFFLIGKVDRSSGGHLPHAHSTARVSWKRRLQISRKRRKVLLIFTILLTLWFFDLILFRMPQCHFLNDGNFLGENIPFVRFPFISGVSFSFAPSLPPSNRIRKLALNDQMVYENGVWCVDPESQNVSVATKEYLLLGKDGYDVMLGVRESDLDFTPLILVFVFCWRQLSLPSLPTHTSFQAPMLVHKENLPSLRTLLRHLFLQIKIAGKFKAKM